ncbi:MAG: hypothetical protein ACR5LD_03195 [Symbiopectobacterium sp.]
MLDVGHGLAIIIEQDGMLSCLIGNQWPGGKHGAVRDFAIFTLAKHHARGGDSQSQPSESHWWADFFVADVPGAHCLQPVYRAGLSRLHPGGKLTVARVEVYDIVSAEAGGARRQR